MYVWSLLEFNNMHMNFVELVTRGSAQGSRCLLEFEEKWYVVPEILHDKKIRVGLTTSMGTL